MLTVEIDHCAGIITFHCGGQLDLKQIKQAQFELRAFLSHRQHLQGFIWHWQAFPYCPKWQDGQLLWQWLNQLNQLCCQHAIVSNNVCGDLLAKLSLLQRYVLIRHFADSQLGNAKQWLAHHPPPESNNAQ
ncbi:STAS/SEC14 domain-containing protein [Ferrimonas senticii]|uniref:STAS/SEC14 domain-containing protein n=1 Tax=Ferrimonas senticii TaxID=394566 RepID=UPI000414B01C|nr:STAS/SEC14 domain-containing protein [Ferrimonas senticii]